jgi:hypothetical protein
MDKLDKYRTLIQQLLEEYAQFGDGDDGVDNQVLIDTQRDHYQLMHVGWQNDCAASMAVFCTLTSKTAKSGCNTTVPSTISPPNWSLGVSPKPTSWWPFIPPLSANSPTMLLAKKPKIKLLNL